MAWHLVKHRYNFTFNQTNPMDREFLTFMELEVITMFTGTHHMNLFLNQLISVHNLTS
jgi:hypothetical protein